MNYKSQIKSAFEDVRRSERILSSEFVIRLVLVMIVSMIGWYLLNLTFLPLWVGAYFIMIAIEKAVLNMAIEGREYRAFVLLWMVSLMMASVYAWLPVTLWRMDGDIWKFATVVLPAGAVLNIFLLRTRNFVLGVAFLIPIQVAVFVIALDFFVAPYGGPSFLAAMALGCSLTLYFGVCLWEAHRANRELRATRAQFLQAQKVEALGTLTSGVAHDFNNLLSVIQGNLELLEAYPDAEDRHEFLTAALRASQRGAQLTRQLTSYGRKAELWPRNMRPADVLHALDAMARRVLPANIAFKVEPMRSDGYIYIDESLLQSALLNLIINARDAMSSGGTLRVRLHDPARPPARLKLPVHRTYVAFEVSDTGHGIAPDIMANIRDPFFTTKPVGQGSGLGLPMVSGFAVQSEGELDITSTAGTGTTVRLYLPRLYRPGDGPTTQARPQPISTSPN